MPIATEPTTEPLYCAGCGDEVATLDPETEKGPCCHNLPRPWHRGRDGLFNSTVEVEDDPDEDDEDRRDVPHCCECGSTEWIVSATQRVDTSDEDESDGMTIYYQRCDFDFTARCACCETQMPTNRYELEEC